MTNCWEVKAEDLISLGNTEIKWTKNKQKTADMTCEASHV